MSTFVIDRSSRARTGVVALATLAALAVLVAVLARWTWVWLAPPVEARAVAALASGGGSEHARRMFGVAAATDAQPAPSGLAVTLLGIVAASGDRSGYALIRFEGQPSRAVREGDEAAPGIRLAEVAADHVVLERAGARERLALPKPAAAPAPAIVP